MYYLAQTYNNREQIVSVSRNRLKPTTVATQKYLACYLFKTRPSHAYQITWLERSKTMILLSLVGLTRIFNKSCLGSVKKNKQTKSKLLWKVDQLQADLQQSRH